MKTLLIATVVGLSLAQVWSAPTDEHLKAATGGKTQTPKFEVEWRFNVDWKDVKGTTPLNEKEAGKYLGKVVWISIGYQNQDGEIIGWKHRCGTITTYSRKEGIQVDLIDSDDTASLPSAPHVFRPRPGGVFRLSESRNIENPDYLAIWYCTKLSPSK